MGQAALDELRRELKQPDADLAPLAPLKDEQLALLGRKLREARTQQRAALRQALDDSLGFIPALLRLPIQKILFRK